MDKESNTLCPNQNHSPIQQFNHHQPQTTKKMSTFQLESLNIGAVSLATPTKRGSNLGKGRVAKAWNYDARFRSERRSLEIKKETFASMDLKESNKNAAAFGNFGGKVILMVFDEKFVLNGSAIAQVYRSAKKSVKSGVSEKSSTCVVPSDCAALLTEGGYKLEKVKEEEGITYYVLERVCDIPELKPKKSKKSIAIPTSFSTSSAIESVEEESEIESEEGEEDDLVDML